MKRRKNFSKQKTFSQTTRNLKNRKKLLENRETVMEIEKTSWTQKTLLQNKKKP